MKNLFTKLVKATLFLFILLAFIYSNAANTHTGTYCPNFCSEPPIPPTAFGVTGGGSYCQGGVGVPVGVDNSETGVIYTLYEDNVTTGQTVAGSNGSPITFGNQVVSDLNVYHTFTVKGTNVAGTTDMNSWTQIVQLQSYDDQVEIQPMQIR